MPNQSNAQEDPLAERAAELEVLRKAEHETAFAADQREMTGEISMAAQHPADVADFTFQRELQLTTQAILEREAAQVDEAMRQRDQGQYGICTQCGREIGQERMRARPEATLCIDCQRAAEHPHSADRVA